jgi:cytochrome P450
MRPRRWWEVSVASDGLPQHVLRAHVAELVETLLDQLGDRGAPADLHEALSFPLPVQVICELLGVPYSDRAQFRVWSAGASNLGDRQAATDSLQQLVSYMHQLITHKRAHPGQDVISDLASTQTQWRYGDEGIAGLAAPLLFAGHETTTSTSGAIGTSPASLIPTSRLPRSRRWPVP